MKKYISHFCILLGAFLVAVTTANAQQIKYTINLPNSSTLLARITGGSLVPIPQSTGIINNGDAIAMPLVYLNGGLNNGYKFNITGLPGTATSFQWSVSGDLVIQGPNNNTNVVIQHRNAIQRGPAIDTGQSKGRISFSWGSTISGCGGRTTYTFDVYKVFNGYNDGVNPPTGMLVVPPIIGSNCIKPNTQYTYSVDPIVSDNLNAQIGIDRYFWDVSATGGTINYYSTDSSSVTFTTGATVPASCSITCGMGQANYPPLQTTPAQQAYAEKNLQAAAGVPVVTLSGAASGTITAGSPYCILTNGSTVTPLTFTVTPQPGTTYSWTFGTVGAFGTGSVNDWNTSPAQTGPIPYTITGNSLTIANIFNQPGVVTLTVTDVCGNITNYHYQIKRELRAVDASLITIANNCLTPGGNTTVSIATAPAVNEANLNTLTWAPITNWTFPTGSINPGGSVAPGVYTLNASFAGCTASSVPYTINVKPATVAITSPLCFPPATAGNSVTASPASAGNYTWTATGGSTITGTSSTASLTTGTTSPFNITATYTVAAGCSTTSGPVAADLQPATPTYSIPSCISSAPFNITVTNYPGYGTYQLNFVSGTDFINGNYSVAGGTITVIPNGLPGAGTYKLTHINGSCGTASVTLTITPSTPPFTVTAIPNSGFTTLSTNNNTVAYTWYNCSTNTILGNPPANPTPVGTTTWNLNVPNGSANFYFGAQAVVAGCTTRVCINVPGYQARMHSSGALDAVPYLPANIGSIYPNPNSGVFTIELKHVTKAASATIYDVTGKLIYTTKLNAGANRISEASLSRGQYLVVLQVDDSYYAHNVTITK
jgi:hypothetical protein